MIDDIVFSIKSALGMVSIDDIDKLMKKAGDISSKTPDKASVYYTKVINHLSKRAGAGQREKATLADAYFKAGIIDLSRNRKDAAAEKLYYAKKLNSPLNKDAIIFLAGHHAIKRSVDDDIIITLYLDYMLYVTSPSADAMGVYAIFETICKVEENSPLNKVKLDRLIALNLKALKANPRLEWPHYYIGLACYIKGDYNEAMRRMGQSIAVNPGRARAHYYIGKMHVYGGKSDRALEAFRASLRLEPDNADASFLAGKILVDMVEADTPGACAVW